MICSFVVCFHSSRRDNLSQMLRFLCRRETSLVSNSELILVCQDQFGIHDTAFAKTKLFNLEQTVYNRPKMLNYGVNQAEGDVLVLLDSDRILPDRYFEQCVAKAKKGLCISVNQLHQLLSPATDEQVERGDYRYVEETRSETPQFCKKNVFSGNTVMMKTDYLGMDESFVGYGYNDTDFAMTTTRAGIETLLLEETEIHLFHEKDSVWTDMSMKNAVRYCKKWKLRPDQTLKDRAFSVGTDIEALCLPKVSFL